jgi:proteasome lid subunit RPN8/RPN11
MIEQHIITQAMGHAVLDAPRESCGFVVVVRGRQRYIPCENQAEGNYEFKISAKDYAQAEENGAIIAVVHSHPHEGPEMSGNDLTMQDATALPWLIVSPHTGQHAFYPGRSRPRLFGREFVHGDTDCYGLVRDFFVRVMAVQLPNFERQTEWWLKGEDLIDQQFAEAGFVEVPQKDLRLYDGLLFKLGSPVVNHVGVYVGANQIAHHVAGRLSSKDQYEDFWREHTVKVVRHRSKI